MNRLLFVLFLFSSHFGISQNGMYDICPLKVGVEVPETQLHNAENESILLHDLIAEKPTVLVFYRGAWCGYCTKHLAELNDLKPEIEELGFQILGITVDRSSKLEESNERSESEIEVYSDASLETIKAFGLDWKVGDELFTKYTDKYNLDLEAWSGETHHSLPVPSIYVVKEGVVDFQYVNPNYKKRLKPEVLLAILQNM